MLRDLTILHFALLTLAIEVAYGEILKLSLNQLFKLIICMINIKHKELLIWEIVAQNVKTVTN